MLRYFVLQTIKWVVFYFSLLSHFLRLLEKVNHPQTHAIFFDKPIYLPTYQPINLRTNLPTYQPTNLPTYQPTNPPTHAIIISSTHTNQPTYLSYYLPFHQIVIFFNQPILINLPYLTSSEQLKDWRELLCFWIFRLISLGLGNHINSFWTSYAQLA